MRTAIVWLKLHLLWEDIRSAVATTCAPLIPVFVKIAHLWRAGVRWSAPWCNRTIDHILFQTVMFLITVYALVGDDIRLAATTLPADLVFNIITIIAFCAFSFELVANCIGKQDYFLGFFFTLDLISTLSLVLDITWIYQYIIEGGDTSMARAGRMSRVGTRAGRVLRVIRLIRLIRIIKIYKHMIDVWARMKARERTAAEPGMTGEEEVYAESRVGQKLSQMTTQKVILLILFMLIVLPIISVEEFFQDLPTSSQYGSDVVYRAYSQCVGNASVFPGKFDFNATAACHTFEQQLTMYIGYHHRQKATGCDTGWTQVFSNDCKLDLGWIGINQTTFLRTLAFDQNVGKHWDHIFGDGPFSRTGSLSDEVRVRLGSGTYENCKDEPTNDLLYTSLVASDMKCPAELRLQEKQFIWPRFGPYPSMLFVFDVRPWVIRAAVYNIFTTFFICLILAAGAMVFSHDANVLVLQPIESMIAKVQKIRANPLYAMKLGDESYRESQEQDEIQRGSLQEKPVQDTGPVSMQEFVKRRALQLMQLLSCRRQKSASRPQTLETKILENAIIKLGKLLALGFGEAGSEIIGKNMDDDSATVNAMIPGSKVEAVFGFCDIRNFADTTEVLQDKVMVFVNQVAEIVHKIVDTWHGAANRNIGDAFLIVWRMRERKDHDSRVGDMSVISFVQVVAAINKSPVLKEYNAHPALLARLPNYRVSLGFGLHYGWAIEGAIGSEFKIDASYLSPHVNMASRLEALTLQYGVLLLMSEPLVNLCSSQMARHFRTIDRVTLKGGMSTPTTLHTVDMNVDDIVDDGRMTAPMQNQFELRLLRERAKEEKLQPGFAVSALFETDEDIQHMRKHYPPRFFQCFSKGYLNYEAGEWDVAREIFEGTKYMLPDADGPSKTLLDYMARCEFDPRKATPKGWLGYRELTDV